MTAAPAAPAPRGVLAGSYEEAAPGATRISRETDGVLSGNVTSGLSKHEEVKSGFGRVRSPLRPSCLGSHQPKLAEDIRSVP